MKRISLSSLFNSRAGTGTALWLGRNLPAQIGRPLARWAADYISRHRQWSQVRAVRANQWVVHSGQLSGKALDQVVRDTFRASAFSIYEYYHTLDQSRAVSRVFLPSSVLALFDRIKQDQRGWIFVAPHLGNPDLMGRAIAANGIHPLVLSVPRPPGGYQWQNQLRQAAGLEMAPASFESLRLASDKLKAGGMVLTGADRPFPESKYSPFFFNRPAALPVVHIKLALRFNLPVFVIGGFRRADGLTEMFVSEPIPMQPGPDPETEVLANAAAVLQVVESFIRQHPDQWNMTLPVWPEVQVD